MMCSNSPSSNGVILLVYGMPAAGKTRLSTSLSKESVKHDDGSFISVHFDDFYPPDLRTATQEDNCTHDASDDTCAPLFKLKDIRKEINDNVEHLIRINELGTAESDSPTANKGESWSKFLCQISSSNPHATFDDHGRVQGRPPVVLLLDDNMIYHSIRYEYYQMARKYSLGFGEVLVSCPVQLAVSRNCKRTPPLPLDTIRNMADDLEPAQPDKFHWEHNSISIDSLTADDTDAWFRVVPVVQYATTHPVQQLDDNSEQVMADRQLTLDNIIHQADQVLRKCVSKKITASKGSPELPAIAKCANAARRNLLEVMKRDRLTVPVFSDNQQLTMNPDFIRTIETEFLLTFHNCSSK